MLILFVFNQLMSFRSSNSRFAKAIGSYWVFAREDGSLRCSIAMGFNPLVRKISHQVLPKIGKRALLDY